MYIMGLRQYARYVNLITASGMHQGMHRGMNRVRIGVTHQAITLSVKLGEGGSLAHVRTQRHSHVIRPPCTPSYAQSPN